MRRIWLVILGDSLAFWLSFFAMIIIRFNDSFSRMALREHLFPFLILYATWILCFYLFGLYDIVNIKPTIPHAKRFISAFAMCLAVGMLFFYLVPIFGIAPKTNLFLEVLGFGIFSFLLRRAVYSLFSRQITREVALAGKTPYLEELRRMIEENPQLGLKITCFSSDLHEALRNFSAKRDMVFIFEETSEEIPRKDMVSLYSNKAEIIDVAEAYERYFYKIPVSYISQRWIVENLSARKNAAYAFFSRIIDIIFASLIFVISSPFWLLGALAVYFYDRGPIFYTHDRVGLYGKPFRLYKLRSMVTDAEKNGAVWAGEHDPRITPPGRILRKLHVDEIPQMINVLRGDLSMVGPRPERLEFVRELEEKIPYYDLRHVIRPGFTGWAQIKFRYARSEMDAKDKFEYDLYYLKNRNIFLDFGIILRTVQIIFTH